MGSTRSIQLLPAELLMVLMGSLSVFLFYDKSCRLKSYGKMSVRITRILKVGVNYHRSWLSINHFSCFHEKRTKPVLDLFSLIKSNWLSSSGKCSIQSFDKVLHILWLRIEILANGFYG
jgi:hypothetical protein